MINETYRQFAETPAENKALDLVIKHGSGRSAAQHSDHSKSWINGHTAQIKQRYNDHHGITAPDGFYTKKTSTLKHLPNGDIRWEIVERDAAERAAMLDKMIGNLSLRVEGKATPLPAPDIAEISKDVCVAIPMGDPHVGLYAWSKDSEADFDCEKAEKLMIAAVEHLVDVSPEAEEFLLVNLGDFFHSDNNNNQTTKGTPVDVDGRFERVQEIGFLIMVKCIDRALQKYPKVTVHNAIGNHDEHTSQQLSAILSAWYRNEPRVKIIRNPSKFWYFRWGSCMVAVHHGHTTRPQDMPLGMASHKPEMWGETKFRFCWMGHKHHLMKKEYPGVTVEQFRTLAPKDAWHFGNANYISMRDMQSIVLHKKYGEIGRRICPIEYLEGVAA